MSNTQPTSPVGKGQFQPYLHNQQVSHNPGAMSTSSIVAQKAYPHGDELDRITLDSKRIRAAKLINSESMKYISIRSKQAANKETPYSQYTRKRSSVERTSTRKATGKRDGGGALSSRSCGSRGDDQPTERRFPLKDESIQRLAEPDNNVTTRYEETCDEV